jgi:DNA primase
MLFMQPGLASQDDLLWLQGDSNEEVLLQQAIETCLMHPHSKPVVIMRELENKVDAKLLRELERELSLLDETLDFASEFAGARQQLQQAYTQKQEGVLLAQISEKPLSALTENEKALLKNLGNKPSQNRV